MDSHSYQQSKFNPIIFHGLPYEISLKIIQLASNDNLIRLSLVSKAIRANCILNLNSMSNQALTKDRCCYYTNTKRIIFSDPALPFNVHGVHLKITPSIETMIDIIKFGILSNIVWMYNLCIKFNIIPWKEHPIESFYDCNNTGNCGVVNFAKLNHQSLSSYIWDIIDCKRDQNTSNWLVENEYITYCCI